MEGEGGEGGEMMMKSGGVAASGPRRTAFLFLSFIWRRRGGAACVGVRLFLNFFFSHLFFFLFLPPSLPP